MKNDEERKGGTRPEGAKKPGAAQDGRKRRRAQPGPAGALKMGRSLRTGGAYIMRAGERFYKGFNTFTQTGKLPADKKRRGAAPSRRAIPRNLSYAIFLLSIFLIMSVALMVLNNASVSVERLTVSVVGLAKELEGYTILHISDLHGRSFGAKQTSLLRTVNGLNYNLAVFTGDMVGRSNDPQPFYDLLEGLKAKRPMYFIAGDSDPSPLLSEPRQITSTLDELVLSDWVLGAQQRGATYLSATEGVPVGQTTLWLSNVGDLSLDIQDTLKTLTAQVDQEADGVLYEIEADRRTLPFTDYRKQRAARLDRAVRAMKPADTHLALSHYPPGKEYIEVAQQLGESENREHQYLPSVDLVLAGHYCGGGWKLPFLGAPYVPNTLLDRHGWFPAPEDVQGLKALGSTQLCTSPGLSVTDAIALPNFRLFNPPTVTLITLTSAITDDLLGR
ncbi:metallophosphoesterase [Bacillota bacterium Meth-B3]